jgi:hypothetical protein
MMYRSLEVGFGLSRARSFFQNQSFVEREVRDFWKAGTHGK